MRIDYEKVALNEVMNIANKYPVDGKTILDVGCGDGRMVELMAKKCSPNFVYGVDVYLRKSEIKGERFKLINNVDARHLPFDDDTFDFVYSISTFEHINGIAETLAEIHRVLKPGGKFYTHFAPIWTSICGHHVYCVKSVVREGESHDEEIVEAIPAWAHLYMSEDELGDCLTCADLSDERIKAILHYIYHHSDINRYTASDLRNEFINSGMIIRKYCERVAFSRKWALGKKGDPELTEYIINRLKNTKYRIEDIGIVSMTIELEKYQSPYMI